MQKTIDIRLHNFDPTPNRLRDEPGFDRPREYVPLDLARLYFHYYMDGYGCRPPEINIANFEYFERLAQCDDFRFRSGVIPAEKKRTTSNLLGRAFCRHMLHDYLGIVYFADLAALIQGNTPHPGFGGISVERTQRGDTPDYLCARKVDAPMLAEAKGRFKSIGFNTKEFAGWREQFQRVEIRDVNGTAKAVKGYVVATRFTTDSENQQSCVYMEDPSTPGEPMSRDTQRHLGRAVVLGHYSRVCSRLGMPLLAASLRSGFTVPEQVQMQAVEWRFVLAGQDAPGFIGGPLRVEDNWVNREDREPFLNVPEPVFLGLATQVAHSLRQAAAGAWTALDEIEPVPSTIEGSNFAFHKDGTVIGPISMFQPVRQVTL